MTFSASIQISYNLFPPPEIDPATATSPSGPVPHSGHTEHRSLPQPSSSRSPTSVYYNAAAAVIREAQTALNSKLTSWKDAIGDLEKHKEDLGKVAHGQGRAARMTAEAESAASSGMAGNGEDDEEEDDAEE